ncbi:putative hydrolase [Sorangium cellulosum So ce56]|uniref:Hydrolase n=1 Tax=Sorangium cellulosum (strain So ce56) TaxID=448385 RepID=A9FWQ0_SORC5|nr:glycoside hydrolase family 16 protein [Sorangium cellulosum]CAN92401.1 putative hydrolase [Sorangium cellulosum So ce56]
MKTDREGQRIAASNEAPRGARFIHAAGAALLVVHALVGCSSARDVPAGHGGSGAGGGSGGEGGSDEGGEGGGAGGEGAGGEVGGAGGEGGGAGGEGAGGEVGAGGEGGGAGGEGGEGGGGVTVSAEFFDDFSYSGIADDGLKSRWWVRTTDGAPGVAGAQWLSSNVSFIDDPDLASNRLLRLEATTRGSGASTSHAELQSNDDRFRLGTYSARVRFRNTPLTGTRHLGDKLVETFFTISPWINDPEVDPNYSEQDFEYMPNGGWGQGDTSTLWLTSWETATLENTQSNQVAGDQAGWKRLLLQIDASGIHYYIDGARLCTHDATYVPETDQHLDFNLWFDELAAGQTGPRTYAEDVDWVYFAKDVLLSQAEVDAQVARFRASSLALVDTLP